MRLLFGSPVAVPNLVAEAAIEDGRQLESEKRETFKSHVLLEARRARLTAELQVPTTARFSLLVLTVMSKGASSHSPR